MLAAGETPISWARNMATTATIRTKVRSSERQAVIAVEREIRAAVRPSRSRYLAEFAQAFRRYESILGADDVARAARRADLILIGDYHALDTCQHYAAEMLTQLAEDTARPLVLALEAFYSDDQPALDAWFSGEISLEQLRERTQFDSEWGYDWEPHRKLLSLARQNCEAVYGLDCRPRFDLRGLRRRDRHASRVLAQIRRAHPEAQIVGLVGESHLAPTHLPRLMRKALPRERTLTVLQNCDALYWQALEGPQVPDAVRVSDDVICAFNATPLEKYESYRQYLESWGE